MAGINFADQYRAAGLNPGPEILRLRQEPFEKLRKSVDVKTVFTLTRLYFGIPGTEGVDEFRIAFGGPDPSFSLIDNAREAAVLASCLLDAALHDGKIYAGLAPLTAAAAGLRTPVTSQGMLDGFAHSIADHAIKQREREHANLEELNQFSEEANDAVKTLANQTALVMGPLAADVEDLREEVAMLWWYIGGWSRNLDVPFTDLSTGTAALLAGLDMADLSHSLAGPVAAPALLRRIVASVKKGKSSKVTLGSAIAELSDDDLGKIELADISYIQTAADICPVHYALAKARETGGGDGWHAAFEKTSGLTASSEFKVVDLSLQVYREGLLLSALD
jgi:hypothetical protein